MDEEYHQYHHHQFHDRIHKRTPVSNKDAVKVQTGRIIRSTGGKDRHSKVFTSKGPRDRRVRLSAHTAIQFYDVQDRLGYDRPSKAVDWLITNAKAAIDDLAELPPFDPSTSLPEDHGLKCHSTSSVLDGIQPSFRESEAIQIPFTTSEEPVVFDEKNLVAMALQSRYTSFELGSDDFIPSGFCIPARIQGEDDHGHNF